MLIVLAVFAMRNGNGGTVFLKWRVADLLIGFPDIEICFGTRVRSLPDALWIATPKKKTAGGRWGILNEDGTTNNLVCTSREGLRQVYDGIVGPPYK